MYCCSLHYDSGDWLMKGLLLLLFTTRIIIIDEYKYSRQHIRFKSTWSWCKWYAVFVHTKRHSPSAMLAQEEKT